MFSLLFPSLWAVVRIRSFLPTLHSSRPSLFSSSLLSWVCEIWFFTILCFHHYGPSLGSDHSCLPYIHLAHHYFHLHCYQEFIKFPQINLANHFITIFIILWLHYSSLWAFIRLRSFMLTLHSSCPSSPFSSSLSSRVYIIHYHCHHLITIFVGHL